MDTRSSQTVLAVHPTTHGVGFIIMRSALSPIDWGVRDTRGKQKNAQCLEKVAALIEAHQPDAILLEDPTAPGSHRSKRVRRLCRSIAALANAQSVEVHLYSRSHIKQFFGEFGACTRYEVAMVIAKHVTALERFLPSRRKLWENESPRMSIFNAAALAMTFFGTTAA